MSEPLILVASSEPTAWRRVRDLAAGQLGVAYAVDLAGALEVLQLHRPALVILYSRLLDAAVDEALPALHRQRPPATSLLLVTRAEDPAPTAGTLRLADAWISEACLPQLLSPFVAGLRGEPGSAERRPTEPAVINKRQTSSGAVTPLRAAVPSPPPATPLNSVSNRAGHREMVLGSSPAANKLMAAARQAAMEPVTVLLSGETGTGKEMLARWIHGVSPRSGGPFRVVDLPSIPDELFESTLFGHERGAFTGAVGAQPGKFRRAHRGSLFLDEVSSLKLSLQPKLLRAIQEKEVEAVGGREVVACDVRIIAATNSDLAEAVRRGEFRADLYYRLRVVTIDLPPLRERRQDIAELCQFFLRKFAAQLQRPVPSLPPHVLRALEFHNWPGNIRELENWVQRAVLASRDGQLESFEELLLDLEPDAKGPAALAELDGCDLSLEEMERVYLLRVLERTGGNQTQAAQLLGIDRKTLRAKLQKGEAQPVRALRSVR